MNLEQRVAELEKKVAELEERVQEQPNVEEIIKELSSALSNALRGII